MRQFSSHTWHLSSCCFLSLIDQGLLWAGHDVGLAPDASVAYKPSLLKHKRRNHRHSSSFNLLFFFYFFNFAFVFFFYLLAVDKQQKCCHQVVRNGSLSAAEGTEEEFGLVALTPTEVLPRTPANGNIPLLQWSPTTGPRPGTGPRIILYRAAKNE